MYLRGELEHIMGLNIYFLKISFYLRQLCEDQNKQNKTKSHKCSWPLRDWIVKTTEPDL